MTAPRPRRLVTIYLCLPCFNGRHDQCSGAGEVRERWPEQCPVTAECTCADNAHPWSVHPHDDPTAPCPHDGCTGMLVRLAGGVVECTQGHTSGTHGHTCYDG